MRITGLATGLDMDELVKNSMKPYRIKIEKTTQKKDIIEIKQKLYRDVIKDGKELFNKYFDIAKSDSLLRSGSWGTVVFSSNNENIVTAKAQGGAIKGNYEVSVGQLAEKASAILKSDATGEQTISFSYADSSSNSQKMEIKFSVVPSDDGKVMNYDETVKNYNKAIQDKKNLLNKELESQTDENAKKDIQAQLNALNVTAKYSEISGGIVFEAKEFGQGGFSVGGNSAEDKELIAYVSKDGGINKQKITSSKGNIVQVDGIEFFFNDTNCELDTNDEIKQGTEKVVKITGKTDTKELKDKLVGFINDYNKFVEKLNTLTMTKHKNGYDPLTADQKKEMSENEIKLWNEQVEKGQLYRDPNITRIVSSMKNSMRTFSEESKLNVEKIGIKPVEDYSGTKNGLFVIDEEKLSKALEENTEDVMNLFIGNSSATDSSKKGILHQLKDILDDEFVKSSSALIQKAGYEGTATFSNNSLTKSISDYENKIKDMEKSFSRKEQALYTKYATLEKMMNKLNSQQSNLMSQLGMS